MEIIRGVKEEKLKQRYDSNGLRPITGCTSVGLCQAAERLKEATKDAPQGRQPLELDHWMKHLA